MTGAVSWLGSPRKIAGQDHLAVQALSARLYSQLLPGISNVTDRLRYYSFYPWLLFAFDRRAEGSERSNDAFWQFLRRAECLFALVAARHEQKLNEPPIRHGLRMVGRERLLKALRDSPDNLSLATYAARESEGRYFANPGGGFQQYYSGSLANSLGLISWGAGHIPMLTEDKGLPIAQAFEQAVNRELFLRTLSQDTVTFEDLDALAEFCPCELCRSSVERECLLDVLFCRKSFDDEFGQWRKRSLLLILSLAREQQSPIRLNELRDRFRAGAYSGALTQALPWRTAPALEKARQLWGLYHRGELLAVGVQALFWATLSQWNIENQSFSEPHEVIAQVALPLATASLGARAHERFDEAVRNRSNTGPARDQWEDEMHEVTLAERINEAARMDDRQTAVKLAIELLTVLACRAWNAENQSDFDAVVGERGNYEINLATFGKHVAKTWSALTLAELTAWIVEHWGINAHLRVALRKLRADNQDTFRVRLVESGWIAETDDGLTKPQFTAPRLRTAIQMLNDVGALDLDGDGLLSISPLGKQLLETVND
jgi:hypothetical protein